MKKVIAIVCMFFFCREHISAQTFFADSVKHLNVVTVTSNRLEYFNTGNKIEQIDSVTMIAFKQQSLADLLSTQSQLFIKSYGPGSLATSSFRGAGAEHTAVLWNGFNVQSPLNGQIEFSLLQVDLIDELKVQYGSSGALFGSGAVGGMIHIANKPKFESGLHASVSLQNGSFENNKQSVSLSYGSTHFYSSLRLINQYAKNNFPFSNTFLLGSPVVNQTNASYAQQGVMSDNYFLLSKNQQVNVRVWYQTSLRQIPPSMSVPQSKATQRDETLRISSEWNLQHSHISWYVRSAWFDENLVYEDSVSGLFSKNRVKTNISEAESKIRISEEQFLNIGINNTFSSADVDAFNGIVSQNRTSVFTSYKIYNAQKTFQTCLSAREEVVDGRWLPVMPSAGFEWMMNKEVKLFGNVSRSYRVPTLNERYWIPGGNINLKPESGWAEEISLNIRHKISTINFDLTTTIFNRLINDWIQWLPIGGSYSSPQNFKQVWSRGGEGEVKITVPSGIWNFSYSGRINYVLSTNEKNDYTIDESSLYKQLMYVPKLNYMNQLTATYRTFFISFNQTYTGIRFTQSDNQAWLMYYLLGNISAGKEFSFQHFSFSLNAQVKNIWNETYQVIQNMPMPGRNYLIGLTIKI